jgi:chromosome segregation and condensation protein ScpB
MTWCAALPLWVAMENLERRGLVRKIRDQHGIAYDSTETGRALVRSRALDELMANDAELTETPNGHR